MKKLDVEKWLIYILIGLLVFICVDKTLQGILSYFYGEGKKYTTDASKETIREYTHIITSSVSFLIGYFVKGKIDNATLKQQSKMDNDIDNNNDNKCDLCGKEL